MEKVHKACALLDPGAQAAAFISAKLAHKLKLSVEKNVSPIWGFNSIQSFSHYSTQLRIASRCAKFSYELEALLLPTVAHLLPSEPLDHLLESVSNLNLADPQFYKPLLVDIILDVKLFTKILQPGIFEGNANEPGRFNSVVG